MCFLSLAGVLVKTQLIDGEKYKTLANSLSESTVIVKASRGEILGCNGEPLVTNRQGNSLVFKYSDFPSADKQQERNTIIFALICLFEEYDIPWIDRLPVVYEDGALVIDEDKSLEFEYMVGENMLELEKGENLSFSFDDKKHIDTLRIQFDMDFARTSVTPNWKMRVFAQKFGVTDSVLFNYGLASKRWVISVFTYNMLAVEPKVNLIKKVTTTQIEKTEKLL